MKMDSAKNGRWIIPFKEFDRLRVNKLTLVAGPVWTSELSYVIISSKVTQNILDTIHTQVEPFGFFKHGRGSTLSVKFLFI